MATDREYNDTLYQGDHDFSSATVTLPASTITDSMVSSSAAIQRSKLEQNANAIFGVELNSLRTWDDFDAVLPETPAADDLGFIEGTFATSSPMVQAGDLKAAGATTRYARFTFTLPPEYDAGQTVTVRCFAGMKTTIADTAATLDVECYKNDGEGGIGSDLCTTAAASINSVTFANKDYTITPSGLTAGDTLDIRLTVLVNDAATGTAVTATIGKVQMLLDIRG